MAGLRFAVLLAASSFGVLLLAAFVSASSSRPPAVYEDAGDEWRAAPASMTLIIWATTHRFYVGDVLDFKRWNDSVLLVLRSDYVRCSAMSPPARRFTLDHPGLFYFISGTPARCEAGQRMVVRVVDARSSLGGGGGAPTTPAPAPAAPGPGMMVPSGDDEPQMIPVWLKLLVPAKMGFLGGCFFAGVIMCLCRNNFVPLAIRASISCRKARPRVHNYSGSYY